MALLFCPATFTRWLTVGRQLLRMTLQGGRRGRKCWDKKRERADWWGEPHKKVSQRPLEPLTMPRTGTHAHSRSKMPSAAPLCPPPSPLLMLLLLLLLSSTAGAQLLDEQSEEELTPRALRDFYPKRPNLTSEKQLVRLKSSRSSFQGAVEKPCSYLFLFFAFWHCVTVHNEINGVLTMFFKNKLRFKKERKKKSLHFKIVLYS